MLKNTHICLRSQATMKEQMFNNDAAFPSYSANATGSTAASPTPLFRTSPSRSTPLDFCQVPSTIDDTVPTYNTITTAIYLHSLQLTVVYRSRADGPDLPRFL